MGFRRVAILALLLTVAVPLVHADEETGAVPPLSSSGRWFTDALGRAVLLHGFNQVSKWPPYDPGVLGFGDDDAAFMAAEGFSGVRLGVVFEALMPTPGVVETTYLDAIAEAVDALVAHDFFILIDFHQDGFAPMFNGNGLPNWMAITDGQPNPPDAVFPLYYIQNPAMQRAFEHFWANDPGPGGVPLQEYYRQGVEAVVARFKDNPRIIGYDLMNEPWSGEEYQSCIAATGCFALEQERLGAFEARVAAPIRALAPQQLVFNEPFVLFNFGFSPTSMPGTADGAALSFHSYAVGVTAELAVLANAVVAATRDQKPVLVTEFGATTDPVMLDRLATQMDGQMLPWLEWDWETMLVQRTDPAGPGNLRSTAAFTALVRPYPKAVAGTPTRIAFDQNTKVFELGYDAVAPDGKIPPRGLPTVVSLPKRQYPTGYKVKVKGAKVSSRPCAELLTLVRRPTSYAVTVTVRPSTRRCR